MYHALLWMQLMGGPCPKRTLLASNSKVVEELNTGRLIRALHHTTVQTTDRYVDKKGVVRYKGSSQLKSTQTLVLNWHFVFCFPKYPQMMLG